MGSNYAIISYICGIMHSMLVYCKCVQNKKLTKVCLLTYLRDFCANSNYASLTRVLKKFKLYDLFISPQFLEEIYMEMLLTLLHEDE